MRGVCEDLKGRVSGMKRKFGTMINPSAVGNPIVRNVAMLAAAAVVIQAVQRGRIDRRYAAGLAAYYVFANLN